MNGFKLIVKLVVAQLRLHPARPLLTALAILVATATVIWVVSSYDDLASHFDENAQKYLGEYDLLIAPAVPPGDTVAISTAVIEELRQDPGVLEVNPLIQSRVSVTAVKATSDKPKTALDLLVGARPPVTGAPPVDPVLVGTEANDPLYELDRGEWLDESEKDLLQVVLSTGAAEQIGVDVGDEVLVTSVANQVQLRVVGIVTQAPDVPSIVPPERGADSVDPSSANGGAEGVGMPQGPSIPNAFVEGIATNAIYARWPVVAKISGYRPRPNIVQLALRDGFTVEDFGRGWKHKLASADPPLWIVDFATVRGGLENSYSLQTHKSQAYAVAGMASLAAAFIIFSTLSMGVKERTREFAILRAVALSRWQIAAIILCDSLALGIVGWIGGLFAGFGMLAAVRGLSLESLGDDTAVGSTCVILSGLSVLVGAGIAAILPAWNAMRIRPLDAIATQSNVYAPRTLRLALIGLVLTSIAPALVYGVSLPDSWRLWCYALVSYPCLVFGIALMTPGAVIVCRRFLATFAAKLLNMDRHLVHMQLSSNHWRTVGTSLALSLGLALYVSTQIWGHSMLQPFLPGSWAPDILVAFHPVGLDHSALEDVALVEGVAEGEVLPLAVEQAPFIWDDSARPERLRHDNAVLFGIDPQLALAGDHPMLNLDFAEGNRANAIEHLTAGRACIVTEDFQIITGIGVGDELAFTLPHRPQEHVKFRVAGVVSLPGWQWITKFSGVRRHYVRTGALIFANIKEIQNGFNLERLEFCWLNLSGDATLARVESEMQKIAERDAGATFLAAGQGTVTAYRPFARITATDNVRTGITQVAQEVIWEMSRLPLLTLAIMSLAVVSTMVASVRARRWEFGVLRAIGVSRKQLVSMILIESILIGIVACIISLAFGMLAGWCGVGMALYSGGFFGGPPAFVVPWENLLIGFALALSLSLAAALLPAFRTGLAEPLKLLQSGRNSI